MKQIAEKDKEFAALKKDCKHKVPVEDPTVKAL